MDRIFCAVLALAGAGSAAFAGEAKPAPSAPASAVTQPPVLDGYRRYEQAQPIGWRQANEEAAALGGHVGQTRGERATVPAQDADARREGKRGERR